MTLMKIPEDILNKMAMLNKAKANTDLDNKTFNLPSLPTFIDPFGYICDGKAFSKKEHPELYNTLKRYHEHLTYNEQRVFDSVFDMNVYGLFGKKKKIYPKINW